MGEYADAVGVTITDAEQIAEMADYWEVKAIWLKHRIDWIPVGVDA